MRKHYFATTFLAVFFFSVFMSCEQNPTESKSKVPELVTYEVTEITRTTATCGGNITDDGGATVTARGVCWSIGQTPKVSDDTTNNGTGAGSFTSEITGLTAGTNYYIRAYATNSAGTGYGSAMSFRTDDPVKPTVTTAEVSEITYTTAICGGTVSSDGGSAVTSRGVCWSTDQTPTISDNKTTDGTGTGSFTSEITGLTEGTNYYVRAYATNSVGTGYGESKYFYTLYTHETGTVSDIDGNVYQTIKIGEQWWMAENLKVTHYSNGDAIPNVTDDTEWSNLVTGAYCEYYNSSANVDTYGRLYNWYAVVDSRNIAPEGWHVPTDDEWKHLEIYLGMSQSEAEISSPDARGTDEGGKMKEVGTTRWRSPNTGATNESGFSALPAMYRADFGDFDHNIGTITQFWSSTDYSIYVYVRTLAYDNSGVYRYGALKGLGFSVRLVRD